MSFCLWPIIEPKHALYNVAQRRGHRDCASAAPVRALGIAVLVQLSAKSRLKRSGSTRQQYGALGRATLHDYQAMLLCKIHYLLYILRVRTIVVFQILAAEVGALLG